MKNLALLLLIFSVSTWAQQAKPLSSPEPGAQVRQEFLRAYNVNDLDAVVALYAEDATLVSDAGTFTGRDEIRKWVKSGLDQGSRLEIEPSVEKSSGTLAYGAGRTRRHVGPVVHLGQYLIVMEKINGEWKIVQHFALNAGEIPAANAAPSAAPTLPDQLSVEKWFVGNWICKGAQHPSPDAAAVQFTDKFTFEMALGSWLTLTLHIDQTQGPLQGKRTLIGWSTWDDNAKVHIRRDRNIGGSRVDVTAPGWEGDKLVFTGYMVTGDEKLAFKQTFTRKGDAAFDIAHVVTGAESKPVAWEDSSCRKVGK